MSSILTVPVEILLDMFHANDPAGIEALQLTCRRFNDTIVQNVDTLPTRLVCMLAFDENNQVHLYRAPTNDDGNRGWGADRERIGWSSRIPQKIRDMYETFGRKTAIRKVQVYAGVADVDGRLTHLIENFPTVKSALSLHVYYNTATFGMPTDRVLDPFGRLETIEMRTCVRDKHPSFWRDLFARKAFRRVSKLRMVNKVGQYPAVGDRELFDFITDFSRMPADKPRVVQIQDLDREDSFDALERRFNENIASIGGQVFAVISTAEDEEPRYLTNMADVGQKETLARQLLRDA